MFLFDTSFSCQLFKTAPVLALVTKCAYLRSHWLFVRTS
jgi:hypothetical protein